MYERLPLEEVAPAMKWGFLADNILLMLKKYERGEDFDSQHKHFVAGAIDFLRTILEGVDNLDRYEFEKGGIGRIVESLTLYGYANQVFFETDKKEVGKQISELLETCETWETGEIPTRSKSEELKEFFSAIAQVTLREASNTLSASREPEELKWIPSKSLATS